MCIAIYKPKGKQLPSKEYIKNCWDRNSDGAGFMFLGKDNKTWHIRKGFMKLKALKKALYSKNNTDLVNRSVVLHFRYMTCGTRSKEMTHPFPISKNLQVMGQTEWTSEQAMAHNGVVGMGEEGYSDTMVFTRDYLFPLRKYLNDKDIKGMIETLSEGSKMIIVNQSKVLMTGKFIKDKGVYYSNNGYKTKPITYYKSITAFDCRDARWNPLTGTWEWDEDKPKKKLISNSTGLPLVPKEIIPSSKLPNSAYPDDPHCPNCEAQWAESLSFEDNNLCYDCGTLYDYDSKEIEVLDMELVDQIYYNEEINNYNRKGDE